MKISNFKGMLRGQVMFSCRSGIITVKGLGQYLTDMSFSRLAHKVYFFCYIIKMNGHTGGNFQTSSDYSKGSEKHRDGFRFVI